MTDQDKKQDEPKPEQKDEPVGKVYEKSGHAKVGPKRGNPAT